MGVQRAEVNQSSSGKEPPSAPCEKTQVTSQLWHTQAVRSMLLMQPLGTSDRQDKGTECSSTSIPRWWLQLGQWWHSPTMFSVSFMSYHGHRTSTRTWLGDRSFAHKSGTSFTSFDVGCRWLQELLQETTENTFVRLKLWHLVTVFRHCV